MTQVLRSILCCIMLTSVPNSEHNSESTKHALILNFQLNSKVTFHSSSSLYTLFSPLPCPPPFSFPPLPKKTNQSYPRKAINSFTTPSDRSTCLNRSLLQGEAFHACSVPSSTCKARCQTQLILHSECFCHVLATSFHAQVTGFV